MRKQPKTAYPTTSLFFPGLIFTESGIHDIDVICWLVDEFPTTVYAMGHANDPDFAAAGDVDTIFVTLKFPGGVIGNFEISWYSSMGYDQRVEVGNSFH